jgi:hypothetical protein
MLSTATYEFASWSMTERWTLLSATASVLPSKSPDPFLCPEDGQKMKTAIPEVEHYEWDWVIST